MSRTTWNIIKQSKFFYVNTYRRVAFILFISILVNLILGLVIFYVYINQPEHDFYATSGVTAPIELTALNTPNYSSEPLLERDPDAMTDNKVMPQ